MITGVKHGITPNTMSTSFTGVRQSKFVTSYVEEGTAYLNIDEDEDLGIEPVAFNNLLSSSPIYTLGIRKDVENEEFAGVEAGLLESLGVESTIAQDISQTINDTLRRFNIISNSQATMFLANVLSNSNNLKNMFKPYNISDEDLENSIVKFGNSSPFSGQTKYYDITEVKPTPPYIKYVNSGTPDNIVYNPSTQLDITGTVHATGNVDFDSDFNVDGGTTLEATTTDGLLDINAGGQANTFKVEDLTNDRVVIAGAGG